MPRQKSSFTETLFTRVTPETKDALARIAAHEGTDVSSVARRFLLVGVRRYARASAREEEKTHGTE